MFARACIFFVTFSFLTVVSSSLDSIVDITKLIVTNLSEQLSAQEIQDELQLLLDKLNLTDNDILQLRAVATAYDSNKQVLALKMRTQQIANEVLIIIKNEKCIESVEILEQLRMNKKLRLDLADMLLDLSNCLQEGATAYKNYLRTDNADPVLYDKVIAAAVILRLIDIIEEFKLTAQEADDCNSIA